MAIVSISPGDTAAEPYLESGTHGPGLEHDAEITLWRFEFPAVERPCPFAKEKAWVAENPERNHHAYFGFAVVTPAGHKIYLDRWVKGTMKTLKRALLECGVEITDHTNDRGFDFDSEKVAPRPIAGLTMSEPREYEGEMRSGFINKVLSR